MRTTHSSSRLVEEKKNRRGAAVVSDYCRKKYSNSGNGSHLHRKDFYDVQAGRRTVTMLCSSRLSCVRVLMGTDA